MSVPGWGTPASTEPARRRTPVAELFEETFRLYARHFLLLIGFVAAFTLPVMLLSAPFTVWQLQWSLRAGDQSNPFGVQLDPTAAPPRDLFFAIVIAAIAFSVVAVILGMFAGAAVSYIVGRARSGDEPPAREVFMALRRLAGPIVGFAALYLFGAFLLLFGLVVAVVIVATIGLIIGGGEPRGTALFGLLFVIGCFAIVVIIIAVAIRLSLALPALVLERLRPIAAFRRSWDLVRGSTWRTFGVLALAGFAVVLVSGLLTPIYIPGVFQGLLTGSPGALLIVMLASVVSQLLLGPLIPILTTLLYFDYARRPDVGAGFV